MTSAERKQFRYRSDIQFTVDAFSVNVYGALRDAKSNRRALCRVALQDAARHIYFARGKAVASQRCGRRDSLVFGDGCARKIQTGKRQMLLHASA